MRSYNSATRSTYARIHALSKAVLTAFNLKPMYVIEFIDEECRRLDAEELDEVILHELLHIPRSFSGGLRRHDRSFLSELKYHKKVLRERRRAL